MEEHPKRGTPVPSGQIVAPPGKGIVVDGREIRAFVFLSTHRRTEVLVQPFLAVLGIPNLGSRADQVGAWDAAAVSAPGRVGLFAWHRRKLGWLDPSQVRCVRKDAAEIVLQPVTRSGGTKLVLAPIGLTTAIAVEVRRREGAEQDMCGGGVSFPASTQRSPSQPARHLSDPARPDPTAGRRRADRLADVRLLSTCTSRSSTQPSRRRRATASPSAS